MSWIKTPDAPCLCACAIPSVTVEYRSIVSFGGSYSPDPEEPPVQVSGLTLVNGADFTDLAWGSRRIVTVDVDGAPVYEDVGGSGSEASITQYVVGEDTITICARAEVRITCTGNGLTYRLRLRTVTIDEDDLASTEPFFDATVTPLIDTEIETTADEPATLYEEEIPFPTGANDRTRRNFLIGPPAVPVSSLISWWAVQAEDELRKRGFPEYYRAGFAVPKIYKRETADGGFPGCPAQELPPKTYSGYQRRKALDYDPVGDSENTLSDDAVASGHPSEGFPGFREPPSARVDTATTRTITRTVACGEETHTDELILTLSDEYTTGAMRSALDDEIADRLAAGSPFTKTALIARQILSRDAVSYRLAEARYTRRAGIYLWRSDSAAPVTASLTLRWRKRIFEADTGSTTTSEETATLDVSASAFGPSDTLFTGESAELNHTATEGRQIILDRLRADDVLDVNTAIQLERPEEE